MSSRASTSALPKPGSSQASCTANTGPAKTHTPISVFDLRFHDDGAADLELPLGWTTLVFPLEGDVGAGPEREAIPSRHFGAFDREDDGAVQIHAKSGARVLVLAGEPLHEPRGRLRAVRDEHA